MANPSRITAPNAAAWRPNDLEVALTRGLASDAAPFIAPYFLSAQIGRMNDADSYSLALQQTNAAAAAEGAAERAAEQERARMTLTGQALEHPGAAAAFNLSARELTSPEVGQQLLDIHNRGNIARAIKDEGAGLHSLVEAGVQMPAGSNYSLAAGPGNNSVVQGTPLDLQVANVNAAARVASARAGGGKGGGRMDPLERIVAAAGIRDFFESAREGQRYERNRADQVQDRDYMSPAQLLTLSTQLRQARTAEIRRLPARDRAAAMGQLDAWVGRQIEGARGGRGAAPAPAVPGNAAPSPNAATPVAAPAGAPTPPPRRPGLVSRYDARLDPVVQRTIDRLSARVPGVNDVGVVMGPNRQPIGVQYVDPRTGATGRMPLQ